MITITCDFCGRNTNLVYTCKTTFMRKEGWENILGKVHELEVCKPCFDAFIENIGKKNFN